MVIAFAVSAGMTTLVLLSGAVLTFLFRGRTHAIEAQGEEVSSTNKSLYAATIEHLQSLKAAKTYGAEKRNFRSSPTSVPMSSEPMWTALVSRRSPQPGSSSARS